MFDWTKFLRVELDAIHQSYATLEKESQRRHIDACVQIEILREEIRHLTLEHVIPSQQLANTLHRRMSSESNQPFGVQVSFCAGYSRCHFNYLSKGEDGLGMHLAYTNTFPLQFASPPPIQSSLHSSVSLSSLPALESTSSSSDDESLLSPSSSTEWFADSTNFQWRFPIRVPGEESSEEESEGERFSLQEAAGQAEGPLPASVNADASFLSEDAGGSWDDLGTTSIPGLY